jgi:hypothetical protein
VMLLELSMLMLVGTFKTPLVSMRTSERISVPERRWASHCSADFRRCITCYFLLFNNKVFLRVVCVFYRKFNLLFYGKWREMVLRNAWF